MRKSILYIAIAAFVSALGNADAAYVIKLKNGNEFLTGRYWQEGRQIMFDTYGGVFGVDKAFVVKIERSDKPLKLEYASEKPAPESETQAEESKVQTTKKEGEGSKKGSESIEATEANKAKDSIVRELNALKEKFATRDGMLTSELSRLIEELSDFRKKLLTTDKVTTYINEFTEAMDMGNATEVLIKSRGQ